MEEGTSKSAERYSTTSARSNLETQTTLQENDSISITSKEIKTQRLDINPSINTNVSTNTVKVVNMVEVNETILNNNHQKSCTYSCVRQLQSLCSKPKINIPALNISSNLVSPTSFNIPLSNQPRPLFLLALAKLNESSLNLAAGLRTNILQLASLNCKLNSVSNLKTYQLEISPPGSLTSAPPSYSFVLQQIAVRRRPRLMGTFILSPSFVPHTPPPNYATAFDIYVDNTISPPPPRVYHFGFAPITIVCPECGYIGNTMTTSKITLCTHLCALLLCLLCCWLCAPLPYMLKSCKDVYHYCRNCRVFLGMYCPSNPENAYTT